MMFFPATSAAQLRLYLDESGTLGFGDEVFTMAMVLVNDLAKLEGCIARNKTTQAEIKASQMKTAQKLALAKTILEHNDLEIYLLTIDPAAANACERKLDKELLYDSMIAQAMAYYLERDELPRGGAYRLSLDMRGGIRESFEDMVCESIGNVLMHREEPLVSDLQIRYMDSKYSAGVQVADLFSNIYRTALSLSDSPCNEFLRKGYADGIIHLGFSFGLPELANQMAQIANDLRAHVEYNAANNIASAFRMMPTGMEEVAGAFGSNGETQADKMVNTEALAADSAGLDVADDGTADDAPDANAEADGPAADIEETANDNTEQPRALSRSARRRRSRAARKAADAKESAPEKTQVENLADAVQTGDTTNATDATQVADVAGATPIDTLTESEQKQEASIAAEASTAASETSNTTAAEKANSSNEAAEKDSLPAIAGASPVDQTDEKDSSDSKTSPKSRRRSRKPKNQANAQGDKQAQVTKEDVQKTTSLAEVNVHEGHAELSAASDKAMTKDTEPAADVPASFPAASSTEPVAESVVITARERRQKAAKKTSHGSTKSNQEQSADGKKGDVAKNKTETTSIDTASSDTPKHVGAPVSVDGRTPAIAPQDNIAADYQSAPVSESAPTSKADTAPKPKRTRTRSRSKAKEAPAEVKTETSQAPASAETAIAEAVSVTQDVGSDNPAPAKPRARRTRTRKTPGSDAQAQSE